MTAGYSSAVSTPKPKLKSPNYLLGAGFSEITDNTSVGVEKIITGHTLVRYKVLTHHASCATFTKWL
jgi:hypothetical protein